MADLDESRPHSSSEEEEVEEDEEMEEEEDEEMEGGGGGDEEEEESEDSSDSGEKSESPPLEGKPSTTLDAVSEVVTEKEKTIPKLWTHEDTLVLLTAVVSFKKDHTSFDKAPFHEHVKPLLSGSFDKEQVWSKLRRLKQKYERRCERIERKGKELSNQKERKIQSLSSSIWGNDRGNRVDAVAVAVAEQKMGVGYGGCVSVEEIQKAGMELVEGSERKKIEAKWRKLKLKEMELFVERTRLVLQESEKVLAALKRSSS